jgi:hypothetical protein
VVKNGDKACEEKDKWKCTRETEDERYAGKYSICVRYKNRTQVKEENKTESKGPREIKEAVFDKLLEQRV